MTKVSHLYMYNIMLKLLEVEAFRYKPEETNITTRPKKALTIL